MATKSYRIKISRKSMYAIIDKGKIVSKHSTIPLAQKSGLAKLRKRKITNDYAIVAVQKTKRVR